jgi:hypothetical protein
MGESIPRSSNAKKHRNSFFPADSWHVAAAGASLHTAVSISTAFARLRLVSSSLLAHARLRFGSQASKRYYEVISIIA